MHIKPWKEGDQLSVVVVAGLGVSELFSLSQFSVSQEANEKHGAFAVRMSVWRMSPFRS